MKNRFVFSAIISIAIWFFVVIPSSCFTETARIDSLLRELKNSKQEERFEILHDLGWAYKDIDTEKAMEFEQTALNLAINWGDSIRVARSLYHLARINTHRNYDLAVKYSERSIGLIIYNEDAEDIAKYYRNLVFIHENNYQYEAALNTYERAYAYLANHDEIISTDILQNITEILINMGDYEAAQEKCEKRLQIWEKYGDDYKIAESYLDLGRIYWFWSEYSQSNSNFQYSYQYLLIHEKKQKENLEFEKSIVFLNLANIYLVTSNYFLVITNIKKMINSKEIFDQKRLLAQAYKIIARVFYYFEQYNVSYNYELKVLDLYKKIENPAEVSRSISILGNYLFNLGYYDLAYECYVLSIKEISKYNNIWSLSICINNLGEYFRKIDDYENSIKLHELSLSLKNEINDKRGIAYSLRFLGDVYYRKQNLKKTIEYYESSLEISLQIEDKDLTGYIYKTLSEIFESEKIYIESLHYIKLYDQINSIIFSNEKLAAINQMDIELTSLEKQKELDLLERENSIISRELEKEKLIRVILIMLTSALLLFAVSLILYSRSIKRSNQKLADEINTRTQSEAVLQELKQELEQRVKDRTSDLMDINEQLKDTVIRNKRSEKILMEAEKMAGIGELAAGIAHEIRNPIAIIKSTAQYLKENYSETEKIMKNLIYNSDEINQVIFKLMEFAKLDSPNPEEVKISTFLKICLEKFEYEIVQRQIELRIEELQQDITVKIDDKLYEILLTNLISNALEGILDKGIITLALTKEQTCLLLEITDNGTGIENPEKALIPFFTTKKHHSGLGLCFVKHIAALHNTKFELESDLGRGTKVKLSIILN